MQPYLAHSKFKLLTVPQEDKDSCKRASRDLDDQYRARDSKQSLK